MQIHSLHQAQSTQSISSAKAANAAESSTQVEQTATQPADQLDISPEALELSQAQEASASAGEIRMEKVASIKQAIADGTYETPEKLSVALDRLLDSFA